jgi:hypothetical protein
LVRKTDTSRAKEGYFLLAFCKWTSDICKTAKNAHQISVYLPTYLSLYLSACLWLYSPLLGPSRFFSSLIYYTIGRTLWTGYQPVAKPLPAHRIAQTQNKRRQTSMSWVGFERATTVHALDRPAAAIDKGLQFDLTVGWYILNVLVTSHIDTEKIRDSW